MEQSWKSLQEKIQMGSLDTLTLQENILLDNVFHDIALAANIYWVKHTNPRLPNQLQNITW